MSLVPLHQHIRDYNNPHLGRLTHQPGCLTARRTWMVSLNVGFFLGAFMLAITALHPTVGGIMALACISWLIVPLTIMVPPFVTLQAINVAVDDLNGQEFDVLRSTTLSNWQLGGGYVLATLWRVRSFVTVQIGAWLAIIVTTNVAFVLLNGLDNIEFQSQNDEGLRLAWLITVIGLQQIGLVLALAALPIAIAVRFGKIVPFTLVMPFAALVTSLGGPLLTAFVLPIEDAPLTFGQMVASLLLGGWSWVLFAVSLWATMRWVRFSHA